MTNEARERLSNLASALEMYGQYGGKLISQDDANDAKLCAADLRALLDLTRSGEVARLENDRALILSETIVGEMQEEFPAFDAYDEDEIASFEAKIAGHITAALSHTGGVGAPEGYKLVPVEPTEAMIAAGVKAYFHADGSEDDDARTAWSAMLSASTGEG